MQGYERKSTILCWPETYLNISYLLLRATFPLELLVQTHPLFRTALEGDIQHILNKGTPTRCKLKLKLVTLKTINLVTKLKIQLCQR